MGTEGVENDVRSHSKRILVERSGSSVDVQPVEGTREGECIRGYLRSCPPPHFFFLPAACRWWGREVFKEPLLLPFFSPSAYSTLLLIPTMTDNVLDDISHRRFNPLRGSSILVSPHRTKRPWQ